MKYIVTILVAIAINSICCAKDIGVTLDSLTINMNSAIDLQRDIEIKEIKGVYKLTVWHFMPSPGLGYDFINGRYYVTVSFSPSAFISNMISKRQETRRISATNRKYENQTKVSEIRLKSLFVSVNQQLENIQLSYAIVINDMEYYKIKSTEYANNEIDTETFLKERSTILNKIKTHNNEVADIQRQLLNIELLTETEIPLDLTDFIISPANILGP